MLSAGVPDGPPQIPSCWLGVEWDSYSTTVCLSLDNQLQVHNKQFRALMSQTFFLHMWESLMSLLKYATDVVPLRRFRHHHHLLEGNDFSAHGKGCAFLFSDLPLSSPLAVASTEFPFLPDPLDFSNSIPGGDVRCVRMRI